MNLALLRHALLALAAAGLGGCATAPAYRKPALDMPAAWQTEAPWRASAPRDGAAKGEWWLRFQDPQLDSLMRQAMGGNQTLAVAQARLTQARSLVASSEAATFPQVNLGARVSRFRISANRPLTNYNSVNFSTVQDDYAATLSVNYEADLAGRVQSTVDGARASAEQSAADLENLRLLVGADLASNYFSLRALDTELDVLSRSIALQRRALELATARHELGASSGLDVAQQQALLDNTLTQVDLLRRQRGLFEHAIATLTGTAAPRFTLGQQSQPMVPPAVPLGLPSDLLERRPDVASAERAMAVANAQIGVANAAFYPSIVLNPALGVDSRTLSRLFDAPSLLWSLGVSATQALFDGGRLDANLRFAKAGYEATVSNYRRVVLTAMQEAEDGISSLAALERAHAQARTAVQSARRVLDLANSRYEGGVSSYLDVITAQQSLLNSERQAAQLLGQRMLTSVFLVKALGGG
ncbi:MAG: efflux transporter outer membrane subunit [Burkholderiaceae bacterium]|nr:efflux transporter outer membrane subunit [Burkholderiaceae bacterium]MDO9088712.1 efflux transporter outer membrane subunit [Burkholderiaceae bacterium]